MNQMNWLGIYPEIVLLAMACVIALADLFVTDAGRRLTYGLTLGTLLAVAGLHLAYFEGGFTLYAMQRMVVTDPMSHLLAFFAKLPNPDKQFSVMAGISHASFQQKNYMMVYHILAEFFAMPFRSASDPTIKPVMFWRNKIGILR